MIDLFIFIILYQINLSLPPIAIGDISRYGVTPLKEGLPTVLSFIHHTILAI